MIWKNTNNENCLEHTLDIKKSIIDNAWLILIKTKTYWRENPLFPLFNGFDKQWYNNPFKKKDRTAYLKKDKLYPTPKVFSKCSIFPLDISKS